MRSVDQQLGVMLHGVGDVQPMSVSLLEASGCFVARDVVARRPLVDDEVVLTRGSLVTTRQLARLAVAGVVAVDVAPRPRVVVLAIGDDAGATGGVAQSNSLVLASAAIEAGAQVYRASHAVGVVRSLRDSIEDQMVRADLMLLIGADAAAYGLLQQALVELGGVEFSRVSMFPGGMVGYAVLGDDRLPVVVLPGETLAAYACFEVFVRPLIRVLAADPQPFRGTLRARSASAWQSPDGVQEFRFGQLSVVEGSYVFAASDMTEPLAVLAEATALASVPAETTSVLEGAPVLVIPLDSVST